MKIIVYITAAHGNVDGNSLVVKYHVDNNEGEHMTGEVLLSVVGVTDTQFNQSILDHAQAQLELAAGTVFDVGDTLLLSNSFSFFQTTLGKKTASAIITSPSLNDQLKTLLGEL